jgi:hypothetical protein
MLQTIYNFSCTCSLCSASPTEKHASDLRRERIATIRELFEERRTSYAETVELTGELLRLVQKENLEGKLREYYHDLMKTYYLLGDIESAIQFAKQALQEAERFSGGEDEFTKTIGSDLKKLRGLLKNKT